MKLVLEIEMDNAAFEYPGSELARILRLVADELGGEDWAAVDGFGKKLSDINGNKCGFARTEGTGQRVTLK